MNTLQMQKGTGRKIQLIYDDDEDDGPRQKIGLNYSLDSEEEDLIDLKFETPYKQPLTVKNCTAKSKFTMLHPDELERQSQESKPVIGSLEWRLSLNKRM